MRRDVRWPMSLPRAVAVLVALGASVAPPLAQEAAAHEVRPGYLELRQTGPGTYLMLWKRPARGDMVLRLSPVFSENCTLRSAGEGVIDRGALLVRAELECAGGLVGETIRIDGLEATRTDVVIRIYYEDGASETHLVRPVAPWAEVGQAAGGWRRALTYTRLGIEHIIQGVDHLLFVLGLLLIVNSTPMLVKTITSFTIAHSITLGIATLGYANAPVLPLNAAIALSILFLGPEILRAQRGETSLTIRHPWIVAFAFGLLHGFGFASGLTTMGLPRSEIPLALLTFNVGVELGQLAFVFLVLALVRAFRVLEVRWPRWAHAVPAYAIGTLGAFWTIDRADALLRAVF